MAMLIKPCMCGHQMFHIEPCGSVKNRTGTFNYKQPGLAALAAVATKLCIYVGTL